MSPTELIELYQKWYKNGSRWYSSIEVFDMMSLSTKRSQKQAREPDGGSPPFGSCMFNIDLSAPCSIVQLKSL